MQESFKKRIQEEGTNAAGYRQYKFIKVPDEKKTEPDAVDGNADDQAVMSRRKMLAGALSTVLSGVALGGLPLEKVMEAQRKKEVSQTNTKGLDDLLTELGSQEDMSPQEVSEGTTEPIAQIEKLSESKYFLTEVEKYAKQYSKDVSEVMEYASKTTKGDEQGRSRIQYVSEELRVDGVPEIIAAELQAYIVGLCDVESSFNAAKESASGAKGLLQFMATTFKEHSSKEANILSLVDQVEAAKNKFKQIYRFVTHACRDELSVIKTEFFFGDEVRFEREFLTPVVINGYNAGEGTMADMVKWFSKHYGTAEKTLDMFAKGEAVSGYDAFLALSQKGYQEGANPLYGSDASSYVLKIYGATQSLSQEGRDI